MQRSIAADAGLPTRSLAEIRGGDAEYNARALRGLLLGEPGAYRDAVLYTAAAALVVAGAADTLLEGVEEAADALAKGTANALLTRGTANQETSYTRYLRSEKRREGTEHVRTGKTRR